MPKYNYTLVTRDGIKTQGMISAKDVENARNILGKEDGIIISVTEKKETKGLFGYINMRFEDKLMFVKHMGNMLQAGLTVTEALGILIGQTKERGVRTMYMNILEMIRNGESLSNSLREYGNIFPDIFITMVAVGEENGNLDAVMGYLDAQMEKEYEIRKKVKYALIYPVGILGLTVSVAIVIVVFIMPRITDIFEAFTIELPLPTRVLIRFSDTLTYNPLLSLFLFILGVSAIALIFKIRFMKSIIHRMATKLPIFGKIFIYSNLGRIARTMNSLLRSGTPVVKAMEVTANMIGNKSYKKMLLLAKEKVERGGQLGPSLEGNEKLFPPLVTKMLTIGEKTGGLELVTERLAELYEREVENLTKNISVLMEPILLVIMAMMVGGIALAIILPIYQLPTLLN